MRKVVITGLGAVTPLGGDLNSSWKNLISGKSGASTISRFDPTGYPCTIACEVPLGDGLNANDGSFNANDWISPKDQKKVDTFILYGIAAAEMALKDSGWKPQTDEDSFRAGVGVGSGIGGLASIEKTALLLNEKGPRRVSPFFIPGALINLAAGQISIRNNLAGFLAYLTNGSNSKYGLLEPKHKFGETHPTINSELLYKIRHGKIFPKNDIDFFKDDYVCFKDGSKEKIDVIIACTGFVLSHPFFKKTFIDYTKGPVSLYLKMFHPDYDNLFFIGMFQPLGCIWPGSEQQSKLLSLALQNKWKRPENIVDLCNKEIENPHIKQIKTDRHRITVDYHQFIKELKYQINKSI